MQKERNITISDVARQAGVSVTMVSFVLNGRDDRVSPETAELIRAAISALGYRPRAHRTRRENLVRKKRRRDVPGGGTGQVALVIPDPNPEAAHTAFLREFSPHLAKALGEYGMDLITLSVGVQDRLPHCLAEKQVQGVILRAGDVSETLRKALANLPCVQFFGTTNSKNTAWDRIDTDDEKMGREAADHLIRQECRRLVVLNPDDSHPAYHLRTEAFLFGARLAGVPAQAITVARGATLENDLRRLPRTKDRLGLYLSGVNHFNDPTMVARWLEPITGGHSDRVRSINIAPGPWLDAEGVRFARHCAEQLYWRMGHPEAEPRRLLVAPLIADHRKEWVSQTHSSATEGLA